MCLHVVCREQQGPVSPSRCLAQYVLNHLSGSLQVTKVDIRDEQDGLGVQVFQHFKQRAVSLPHWESRTWVAIFA